MEDISFPKKRPKRFADRLGSRSILHVPRWNCRTVLSIVIILHMCVSRVICSCPPNYTGVDCDLRQPGVMPSCANLQCEDQCVISHVARRPSCQCQEGRILSSDRRTCSWPNPVIRVPRVLAPSVPDSVPRVLAPSVPDSVGKTGQCRFIMKEDRGVFYTPNFPGIFPIPADCEWIIDAGYNRQTVLYFNEIYLKDPGLLVLSSYDQYDPDGRRSKEHRHVQFDYETYPDNYTIPHRFTVIRMKLTEKHFQAPDGSYAYPFARFRQYLLDVYGFNATYITYPKGIPVPEKHACHNFDCNFAGKCRTSHDYRSFYCECFEGHYGDHCSYGPKCSPSPTSTDNICMNNGTCKYGLGTDRVSCSCPFGFAGGRCEQRSDIPLDDPLCKDLGCSHLCNKVSDESRKCGCRRGHDLASDGRTCVDQGGRLIVTQLDFSGPVDEHLRSSEMVSRVQYLTSGLEKCVVGKRDRNFLDLGCSTPNNATEKRFRDLLRDTAKTGQKFLGIVDQPLRSFSVSRYNNLRIVNFSIYSAAPTKEKSELAIVCVVEGSPFVKFSWTKDGMKFDPHKMRDMWLTEIPLARAMRTSLQLNIENVRRVHQGVYSCEVEDFGSRASQALYVEVLRPPELEIYPATPVVRKGSTLTMTCFANQQTARNFRWFRNGEQVTAFRETHKAFDIQPDRGRQLIISDVQEDAEYTCRAENKAGERSVAVSIQVLNLNEPVCAQQKYKRVLWTETGVGRINEQPCPDDMRGTARRRCNDLGNWSEPVFFDCASVTLLKLRTAIESAQAGFGHRDAGNLKMLMEKLDEFVQKSHKIRGRDMDTAVDMLDLLHNMTRSLDNMKDPSVGRTWSRSVDKLLRQSDTKESVLNILNRFPFANLSKDIQDDGSGGNHLFVAGGSTDCVKRPSELRLENETTLQEPGIRCLVLPLPSHDGLPDWMKVNLSFETSAGVLPSDTMISQVRVERTRNEADVFEPSLERFVPLSIRLWNLNLPANHSDISASITFRDVSELIVREWEPVLRRSSDSSVMYSIKCVQKNDDKLSGWSSDSCNTSLVYNKDQIDLISHVECLCSLSFSTSFFTLRMTNSSRTTSGKSPLISPSADYIWPLVVGLVALVVVGFFVFSWFQRKKMFSCMMAAKKRTSSFIRAHFRSPDTSATQVELPMLPDSNRTTNPSSTDPVRSAQESDHLMSESQRRLSNMSSS